MGKIAVTYNRPSVAELEGVRLMPGVNQIDSADWARALKHPIVKAMVSEGEIDYTMEDEDGSPAKSEDLSKHLVNMSPKEASLTVKQTVDMNLLQSWSSDKRPAVQKAIKEQLDALNAPTEFRERETEKQSHSGKTTPLDTEELKPDFTDDVEKK